MRLVVDSETNGLLPELDTIHCIVAYDLDTKDTFISSNQPDATMTNEAMLVKLTEADEIIMHNGLGFDLPAFQKVYPWFSPKGKITDTLILSQLIYTDLKVRDFDYFKKRPNLFPGQFIGRHSLESWGYRLGKWKGDYSKDMKAKGLDAWASWNQEMQDYCVQDVAVTTALYDKLLSKDFGAESIRLEHALYPILRRQEACGIHFNEKAAAKLCEHLMVRRETLVAELKKEFAPWFMPGTLTTPKRTQTRTNKAALAPYKETLTKEVPYSKILLTEFNPGSRDHIANRMQKLFRWKPRTFTPNGKPKVDEEVLEHLKFPSAKLLSEYLMVNKRLAQIAEGKEAWFKAVKDGVIHGRVNQNGTITGRMSHSKPNMAQVPAVRSPYGTECRALFGPAPGMVQVGADASGLELRCLAHYMAHWDEGAYTRIILNGDVHSANQQAAGLATRDEAKTFVYAFIYGAGDKKIGSIIGKGAKAGGEMKARFLRKLPALGKLLKAVGKTAKKKGFVRGLDGRKIYIRHDHAALNTLLQGAGAVVMKKAQVLLDEDLQALGYTPGADYEFIATVHDEVQLQCLPGLEDTVGRTATAAMGKAGEYFGFKCPLDGEYRVGSNWAECH